MIRKPEVNLYQAQWTAFCTVAYKEIMRVVRIWKMSVMPAVNTFFFVWYLAKFLALKLVK